MINIAYLAGLIDGEGHIAIFRRRAIPPYTNVRYSLRVEICMCSLETINWIHDNFGGTIYKKKRYLTDKNYLRKQPFSICWSSQQALDLLQKVKPFLIAKLNQALIAIKYQRDCPPKAYRLSEAELNRREETYMLLRQAKL